MPQNQRVGEAGETRSARNHAGPTPDITALLEAWSQNLPGSEEDLIPAVYDELRNLAAYCLSSERREHTLQPTALVHETYFRLADAQAVSFKDRTHFFSVVARTMRRVLIDHARARRAAKRGGGVADLSLTDAGSLACERPEALLQLDEALVGLQDLDPEKAKIVELRFFGGLSIAETAETVGCSDATVVRQWRMAKAWLHQELSA